MIDSLRRAIATTAGNLASFISRTLRLGGGTNVPGTVARAVDPTILQRMTAALPGGVTLVSGTNGKTTTTRMIATLLRANDQQVIHNRAGANLITGLTATTLAHSNWRGIPNADSALFETDEAAFPQAIRETHPRFVLIHNLFRDQLDRYGEVDTIAKVWKEALVTLPETSTILLNADDPAVAYLGEELTARVVYYGLDDTRHASGAAAHTADSQFCRRCGHRYDYHAAFYGHIGHYECSKCGHCRPSPHISLKTLEMHGVSGSDMEIHYHANGHTNSHTDGHTDSHTQPPAPLRLHIPLPGLYNAINALAAATFGIVNDFPPTTIQETLSTFRAAFGRIERVEVGEGGPSLLIALIKNPVGASETVRMLLGERGENSEEKPAHPALHLLIAINDRHADGTDVSWLWDADFETLGGRVAHVVVSGTRSADMMVRLRYAGVEPDRMAEEPELPQALECALAELPPHTTLFVLPTYTAMLDFREHLAERGWVRPFWEE
jgi:UDP-N-acetylmuramyl tripeptide synthase